MNAKPIDVIEQLEQRVQLRDMQIRQLKSSFAGFLSREICPYLEIIDEALELDPPRVAVAREKADEIAFHVNKMIEKLHSSSSPYL